MESQKKWRESKMHRFFIIYAISLLLAFSTLYSILSKLLSNNLLRFAEVLSVPIFLLILIKPLEDFEKAIREDEKNK